MAGLVKFDDRSNRPGASYCPYRRSFLKMKQQFAGVMAIALVFCAAAPRSFGQDQPQEPRPGVVGTTVLGTGDSIFDPNQPIKAGFTISVSVGSKVVPEPHLTGVF